MMHIFLQPLDVWLFRDGRPFDAGSDHRAESRFPPYPSVMQGVIRSHHLVVRGVDLRDPKAIEQAVGTADDLRGLRLRGPFLACRETGGRIVRYFPQPADAVTVDKDTHTLRPASAPREPDAGVHTSAPTPLLLGLDDEPTKGEGGLWLDEDALRSYLRGGTVAGVPSAELFARESRFGIGIEPGNRVTCEGALYEAEFIRPCPGVGLLVEVEGYDGWPERGTVRIGGEGRGAVFEQVSPAPWPSPPDPLPARFAVYFATPAFFDGGWQPVGCAWDRYFEGEVRLLAAAVGRYESVGGYDLAAGRHKPARRYVPAGSVYYFAAAGEARLRPVRAVTDFGAAMGFGQILIEEVSRV
ncbi:MAG: CRISPR-associated protein Cmr3 [Dehalococcoidia bacterium]|nr:CRISPR-associated protein Cmr3 [Dehalococcoidia bacterium]